MMITFVGGIPLMPPTSTPLPSFGVAEVLPGDQHNGTAGISLHAPVRWGYGAVVFQVFKA